MVAQQRMRFSRVGMVVGLFVALIAPGCRAPEMESEVEAVNSRPQSFDRFIALVKLTSPALLASGEQEGGKVKVDPVQLELIKKEHAEFEAELTALSAEIRILNRYKFVMNGMAVLAPKALESHFRKLPHVTGVSGAAAMARPEATLTLGGESGSLLERNSVKFIGAEAARTTFGVTGKGIAVGVIDSGIDYTHKMFGGLGLEETYKNNDPTQVEAGTFPTAQVVGGIDLVGKSYNAAAPIFEMRIPQPDADPLDEGGHGTHVAGTVAGRGDGVTSYDGVAPEAALHAIKVFGEDGSTSDAIVIAALEYSADPNGDDDTSDRLDVVNLSLGSPYGQPQILYTEAVANTSRGGTVVVASAGNSGDLSYIVGAPGTSDASLSVAASIDDMDHNWKFAAVRVNFPGGAQQLAEAVEATFTKSVSEAAVSGKFVYLGTAAEALTSEQIAAVQGHVAFIDRGVVTFAEKIKRAHEAGASGVVVANNQDGEAFRMGGDGEVSIPAIMISKSLGVQIKDALVSGDVTIDFKTDERLEKPHLIDTITSFSSRGPRSFDSQLKPEIAAPGQNIVSAKMGGGEVVVQMSGTSMAAPHMAGVMALLRQHRPDLTSTEDLKSVVMNASSWMLQKPDGTDYPVAQQGAGRVDVLSALGSPIVISPAGLSLGEVALSSSKTLRRTLKVRNTSDSERVLTLKALTDAGLSLTLPEKVTVAAKGEASIPVTAVIRGLASNDVSLELDGRIIVTISDVAATQTIPVLAIVQRQTRVKANSLVVHADHASAAEGAAVDLEVSNSSSINGLALPFNLLGRDERNTLARENPARASLCDLESVGYRTIEVDGVEMVEFAVKLFRPLTTWNICEVSVQFDSNGDGVAEQELIGKIDANKFQSILYDAAKMRDLRKQFEATFPEGREDYAAAEVERRAAEGYGHSTIAVVRATRSKLAATTAGDLFVKIGVLGDEEVADADDFLQGHEKKWQGISLTEVDQTFVGLPKEIEVAAGGKAAVSFTKGGAAGQLLLLMPFNASTFSTVRTDLQSAVVKATYAGK